MFKRTLQGVATAATLGTGIILGSLMLGPTSAEPLVDDPEPTGSSTTQPLQHERSVTADGTVDDGCATLVPGSEIRPGSDQEDPGVYFATAPSGEMVGKVPTADEMTELPALSDIAQSSSSDELPGPDCIFASCSVFALDQDFPDGAPTPPLGLPATGISVTEKDGKIVVTDENGTVLLETDAPESGVFGVEIEDGSVRQLDEAELPAIPGIEFQSGGVSTEGCAPLE